MTEPRHATAHRYEAVLQRLNTMISLGIRWERIEGTISAAPELTEEERGALWLYAWARSGQARLGSRGRLAYARD
jgi:hypothetical protein